MELPWRYHNPIRFPWEYRGSPVEALPWDVHAISMGTSYPMVLRWCFGGKHIVLPWYFHGGFMAVGPMVLPWGFRKRCMISPGGVWWSVHPLTSNILILITYRKRSGCEISCPLKWSCQRYSQAFTRADLLATVVRILKAVSNEAISFAFSAVLKWKLNSL